VGFLNLFRLKTNQQKLVPHKVFHNIYEWKERRRDIILVSDFEEIISFQSLLPFIHKYCEKLCGEPIFAGLFLA
jgi:hypothetical protein